MMVTIGLAILISTATAPAECVLPRNHHAWGSFQVGSWKLIRVKTEALDENGNVLNTTITESRMTLVGVNDSSYTLRIEDTVKIAGKQITTEPARVTRGFNGEEAGETVGLNFRD